MSGVRYRVQTTAQNCECKFPILWSQSRSRVSEHFQHSKAEWGGIRSSLGSFSSMRGLWGCRCCQQEWRARKNRSQEKSCLTEAVIRAKTRQRNWWSLKVMISNGVAQILIQEKNNFSVLFGQPTPSVLWYQYHYKGNVLIWQRADVKRQVKTCLLYTSDAADDQSRV